MTPEAKNLRTLIQQHLAPTLFSRLQRMGKLAEQMGVAAFLVGGLVRDLLIGRKNFDVDMMIEADGIAFARALSRRRGAQVMVHQRFGTAVVIFPDGFKLDVATARAESYDSPTALPKVTPSSLKDDLSRRDFTINTLAIRLNRSQFGELIDLYGGRRDLKERTIRVLHNLSFVEDPSRVFRAFRFELRFGFRLHEETRTLVKGTVKQELFHCLSGHRLLEELVFLFSEAKPRKAVARPGELDLLRFIHPSLKWLPRLAALLKAVEHVLGWYRRQCRERTINAWLVYFMALMEVITEKAVGETLQRLTVPERQAEKIRAGRFASTAILHRLAKRPRSRPSETYRALTGFSDETLLLLMAKTKSRTVKRQISDFLTTHRHVNTFLTGTDLKAMGLKPGPIYKKILGRLLEARLNREISAEAEEWELVKRMTKI